MRTVKWNAFLSGLCVFAVALGLPTADAHADVTTERGASILAFPKVLASGGSDTLIQIANVSNNMVHARCFYVNAQLANPEQPPHPVFNPRQWQEIDFTIWLTKQQPTHWQVGTGRFVNPTDSCFDENTIEPWRCANAGLDPGAVPPVPTDFVGELKCVEVDVSGNPIGGNHLKGEATIKHGADVVKYNAIGIEGTERAGETGNELRLDQPRGTDDPVGQYNACPNTLIVNHLAEGVTDPIILTSGLGGICLNEPSDDASEITEKRATVCVDDSDCAEWESCVNGSSVSVDGNSQLTALRSATLTDLTLVPCQEDFEEQIPGEVTVQFEVYNEFEQVFSASTTIVCWENFFLFQINSPNNPLLSPFYYTNLGTTVAQTRITPVDGDGAVIGVAGVLRADNVGRLARVALNIHTEGDRLSETEGAVVDRIILSDQN
jgi:hypothetical protein